MADKDLTDSSAEKAYAEAAADAPAPKAEAKPVAKKAPAKKAVAKKAPAKKAAAKKKATPKPVAKKPAAKKTKPVAKTAKPKPAAKKTVPSIVPSMEMNTMATQTVDFTEIMSKTMTEAVAEMQTKAQEAYDKGTGMVTEMTDAAKGNVEAIVESGQIMATGIQDLGQTFADEAKSAYETATADMKEMASVKSPTELFQLQGKILRRNFDAAVAASSKNSEAAMKLANDVVAPISGRVNLAVEKLSKVA